MAGSFWGISEQYYCIAQHFGHPGTGEVVQKVTHRDYEGNHFDLKTGWHILTTGVRFTLISPGRVLCPENLVCQPRSVVTCSLQG